MIEENGQQVAPADSRNPARPRKSRGQWFRERATLLRDPLRCPNVRQSGQLGTAELPLGIELIDETHDTRLFFGGETLDLVNDLRRSHRAKLIRGLEITKRCRSIMRAAPERGGRESITNHEEEHEHDGPDVNGKVNCWLTTLP